MECGLGFFDSAMGQARVWTLVVHNDFKNFGEDSRNSNSVDVKMIKDEFTRRNCELRELESQPRERILEVISNQKELYRIFGAEESAPAPQAFVLFILSHGTRGGKIYTDHLELNPSNQNSEKYEYYTTEDVCNGLRETNMPKLANCLKILIFGPCRGPNSEQRLTRGAVNNCIVDPRSMWITAKPNSKNFVIVYATVETNNANSDDKGTWLVTAFCRELSTMEENTDLVLFLNKVQYRICNRSTLDGIYGQTPQIQFFKHDKFTIYGCPVEEKTDGKRVNDPSQLITVERKDFYSWRSEKMVLYRRGRALIFHDQYHAVQADDFQKSFQILDFETELYSVFQLAKVIKKVSTAVDCGLIEEGCIAICVLARLREDKEYGLAVKLSDDEKVSVNQVTHSFIGTESKDMAGKPKIFFFVDYGQEVDTLFTGKSADDFALSGNNHAEIFVFLGVGSPKDESKENLVKVLAAGLRDPALKKGLSLQEAMANIVRHCSDGSRVLPQVSSTMSRLLDFPPCSNAYIKPSFKFEEYTEPYRFEEVVEQIKETAMLTGPENRWRKRAWLLSSSAGLGKSAATKEMTRMLRETLPVDFLVICVSLVKVSRFLLSGQADFRQLLIHVLEGSADVKTVDEKIDKHKLVVLFDGFDEICPSYEDLVLKYLRDMNAKDIPLWITTRIYRESSIRYNVNQLNVLDVVPMNTEEQISLLRTLLYKNREQCEDLLKRMNEEFVTTPLHLKMLAETADSIGDMDGGLNSLYYHFVINKVRSAMLKFSGTDESAPRFTEVLKENVELLTKVAMNYFFPENLPSAEDLRITNKDRINELGIAVVTFEKKKLKSITFVHQTFAEYLVSLLFLSKAGHAVIKLPKCEDFLDDIEKIDLSDFLLKNQFDQVRVFIDNYFEGYAKEEKVEVTKLENACDPPTLKKEETSLISYICKEGRASLFQLLFEASFKKNFGEIERLVNTPFQYEFRNEIFSYYPLYAACFSSEDLALQLMDKGAKIELLKQPECKVDGGGNILHLAAKRGLTRVVERILATLPGLANQKDNASYMPLDYAVKNGHFECSKFLIEACSSESESIQLRKRALRLSAEAGHRALVRYLMGPDLDVLRDDKDCPPIHRAARRGHVGLVEELINASEEADVYLAVHEACASDHLKVLALLHEKGANLEQKDDMQFTPLHIAAIHNSKECCQYLLEQKVDINPKDDKNETPYSAAASGGKLEVLKLLEKHGADIFAKSVKLCHKNGTVYGNMTALDRAALHAEAECLDHLLDHAYPAEVKRHAFWLALAHGTREDKMLQNLNIFLDKGFSPNFDLGEGKTPIIVLANRCKEYWAKNKAERHPSFPNDNINKEAPFFHRPREITLAHMPIGPNRYLECITHLIEKGAYVDHVPSSGGSAMHIAAADNDLVLMNVLLKCNANPNLEDGYAKWTPLHYAAQKGKLEAIKFLLDIEGVELDAKDVLLRTPLVFAVEENHSNVVKFLLDKGADISCVANGDTLPFLAGRKGGEVLDLVLEKVTPDQQQRSLDGALCGAVDAGHVDLVLSLFERGAEVTKRNKFFRLPVGIAIDKDKEELVRLLLSLMNCDDQMEAASTALLIAAQKGNLKMAQLLVEEFQADVNARDEDGTSAILWAVLSRASKVVDYLLQFEHLDLVTPSKNGNAPLLYLFVIRDEEVRAKLESRIKEQMRSREAMVQDS